MQEYRDKQAGDDIIATVSGVLSAASLGGWQTIMADYEAKFADGQATFTPNVVEQSVQQEYSTYVMSVLPVVSTPNIFSFWQVSLISATHFVDVDLAIRRMKKPFRRSFR